MATPLELFANAALARPANSRARLETRYISGRVRVLCPKEVHTSFKGFLQKPLSTYAVLAVAISAGEIGLVVASIYEPSLQDCTFPKGLGQQVRHDMACFVT